MSLIKKLESILAKEVDRLGYKQSQEGLSKDDVQILSTLAASITRLAAHTPEEDPTAGVEESDLIDAAGTIEWTFADDSKKD